MGLAIIKCDLRADARTIEFRSLSLEGEEAGRHNECNGQCVKRGLHEYYSPLEHRWIAIIVGITRPRILRRDV